MQKKILVTYATKSGATKEIAEELTATLQKNEIEVDIQAAQNVQSLQDYNAVVLGAPLYMFRWHKDTLNFLTFFRKIFEGGLPITIFAGSPIGKGDEKEWQEVRNQIDKELAKFPSLKPVDVKIIGGKFDPSKLGFPMNLLPAMKQAPGTDLRDWDAIHA